MNYIEKPWGYEKIQVLNDIVLKELFMKAGFKCSLQYHEIKDEIVYVLSGKLKLFIATDIHTTLNEIILISGECVSIEHGMVHRMEAIEDSVYIESSTNHLEDVIRLQDDYGRI